MRQARRTRSLCPLVKGSKVPDTSHGCHEIPPANRRPRRGARDDSPPRRRACCGAASSPEAARAGPRRRRRLEIRISTGASQPARSSRAQMSGNTLGVEGRIEKDEVEGLYPGRRGSGRRPSGTTSRVHIGSLQLPDQVMRQRPARGPRTRPRRAARQGSRPSARCLQRGRGSGCPRPIAAAS